MQRFLVVLALAMTAPLASAQVYKWADASGTIHYSQSPPVKGTQFKQVKPGGVAPPIVPPAAAPAAAPPPPMATEVADTPENRVKLCATLKSSLAALQGTGAVVMQQDGKQTVLDPAQRKQQADAAQDKSQQYCQTK